MTDSKTSPGGQFMDELWNDVKTRLDVEENATPLTSFSNPAFGQLGELNIIDTGDHPHILKLIRLSLNFVPMGADAHAVHIVTKPDSLVPHFSAECIHHDPSVDTPFRKAHDGPPDFGFYINLISRVDPGANFAYLKHVYEPLEASFQSIVDDEDLKQPLLARFQAALLQPWVVVTQTPNAKFTMLQGVARTYLDRCIALSEQGIPAGMVSGQDEVRCASRDAANRPVYLSPDVDPIWPRIDQLIGAEEGLRLREVLSSQIVETTF